MGPSVVDSWALVQRDKQHIILSVTLVLVGTLENKSRRSSAEALAHTSRRSLESTRKPMACRPGKDRKYTGQIGQVTSIICLPRGILETNGVADLVAQPASDFFADSSRHGDRSDSPKALCYFTLLPWAGAFRSVSDSDPILKLKTESKKGPMSGAHSDLRPDPHKCVPWLCASDSALLRVAVLQQVLRDLRGLSRAGLSDYDEDLVRLDGRHQILLQRVDGKRLLLDLQFRRRSVEGLRRLRWLKYCQFGKHVL